MKLGYGEVINTRNELDNIKWLNNQNLKFKSNIKALQKNDTQDTDNDDGNNYDKVEDAGDLFCRNQSKNKSRKNCLLGLY